MRARSSGRARRSRRDRSTRSYARPRCASATFSPPADLRLFGQGLDHRAYEKLGALLLDSGVAFAVWAPEGERVTVIGDFNGWNRGRIAARAASASTGVWQGLVPTAGRGQKYKYRIVSRYGGQVLEKADPYGVLHESPAGDRVDRDRPRRTPGATRSG